MSSFPSHCRPTGIAARFGPVFAASPAAAALATVAMLHLAAPAAKAQQAVLIPSENVSIEYGQVLRAEPIYETRQEAWLERQCPDGNRLLPRLVGAVKDVLKPGSKDDSPDRQCQDVPVEREFRRLASYEVDYMYKGSKYRSRMPYDPGNRVKLRISVAPASNYGN